jgi:hypothetical protein
MFHITGSRSFPAFAAVALGMSCAINAPATEAGQLLPTEPIITSQHSGFIDPTEVVIRRQEDWTDIWTTVYGNVSPMPNPPVVDFDAETIMLVGMGQRSSGGYSVEITEVRAAGDTATVSYRRESPGPGCVSISVLTSPVMAVKVERVGSVIVFQPTDTTLACQ